MCVQPCSLLHCMVGVNITLTIDVLTVATNMHYMKGHQLLGCK